VLIPLKGSYEEQKRQSQPVDLGKLRPILSHDVGFKSFYEFLTTEFSTENLLCWREVDEWIATANQCRKSSSRTDKAASDVNSSPVSDETQKTDRPSKVELYQQSRDIYENYLDPSGAPYLVNIASSLRKELLDTLEATGSKLSSFGDATSPANEEATPEETPSPLPTEITTNSSLLSESPSNNGALGPGDAAFDTLVESFKHLEKALFDLMNSDSFVRFKESNFWAKLDNESKGGNLSTNSAKLNGSHESNGASHESNGSQGSKIPMMDEKNKSDAVLKEENDHLLFSSSSELADLEMTSSQSSRHT